MLISGKTKWCRVVGEPHVNNFKPDSLQWSFDLTINAADQKKLLEGGMRKSYLKNDSDDRETYISFSREATKKDGSKGKPYSVVDAHNEPWPDDKLIGNGSVLNVIVSLNKRTFKKDTWLAPSAIAIQVWEHVPFQKNSEFSVKDKNSADAVSAEDAAKW